VFNVGLIDSGNIETAVRLGAIVKDGVPWLPSEDAATYGHAIHIRDDPSLSDRTLMWHEEEHTRGVEDRGGIRYSIDYYVLRNREYDEDRAHRAESGEFVDRLFGRGDPTFSR